MSTVTEVLDMGVKARVVDLRTPPYQGGQSAAHEWAKLRDAYVTDVWTQARLVTGL